MVHGAEKGLETFKMIIKNELQQRWFLAISGIGFYQFTLIWSENILKVLDDIC